MAEMNKVRCVGGRVCAVHCHLFDIISVADLLSEVICHLYFLLLFLMQNLFNNSSLKRFMHLSGA